MIIDASVASHWFADTEFSRAADPFRWLEDLAAPEFLLVETANVLYKRARKGDIAPDKCIESIEILRNSIAELVTDVGLLAKAIEMALEWRHPVYDCLYLALALERREPLATADRRMAALARTLNIETQLIGPEP
jgi:predicted nucleic acid-binding protein